MKRALVYLEDWEYDAINALIIKTGKKKSELLHEALKNFLLYNRTIKIKKNRYQARGLWKERDDLPDFRSIRLEINRNKIYE